MNKFIIAGLIFNFALNLFLLGGYIRLTVTIDGKVQKVLSLLEKYIGEDKK